MNVFVSIWKLKCPRCRKGALFIRPFHISDPLAMPDFCPLCGLKTDPEPGFYFGAMFLSYIISGFLLLGIALTGVFYFKWSVLLAMTAVVVVGMLSYIRILRVSRSLWIHMTVKYNPQILDEEKKGDVTQLT